MIIQFKFRIKNLFKKSVYYVNPIRHACRRSSIYHDHELGNSNSTNQMNTEKKRKEGKKERREKEKEFMIMIKLKECR